MSKAIYAKYKCVETNRTTYATEHGGTRQEYSSGGWACNSFYSFNPNDGFFTLTGNWEVIHGDASQSGSGYRVDLPYSHTQGGRGERLLSGTSGMSEPPNSKAIVDIYIYNSVEKILVDYSKGSYISDVIAEYSSLPADGKHSDGYWYMFVKMASDLKVNVGGVWRDAPIGYINDGGILRPQAELKVKIDAIWR